MLDKMDSYERFLRTLNIDKNELFEFGISETILPPIDLVAQSWGDLKKRIFNNGVVSIRGYGRDAKGTSMYIDMYKYILNNENVKKDATNNLEPQRIISRLTGYKRNINLFNYQVSHIFGKTKNIFLFEAPWNIALLPKIIDPFTGHETKGIWPEEYQEKFSDHASDIYAEFIDDYNDLITKSKIDDGIKVYIRELKNKEGSTREIIQFEKDVMNELTPIRFSLDIERVEPAKTDTISHIVECPIKISTTYFDSESVYKILLDLKHSKNRSWVQLRNGCLDLLGIPVIFTTLPMKITSRAFAREAQKVTGLSFREILTLLEERKLGFK